PYPICAFSRAENSKTGGSAWLVHRPRGRRRPGCRRRPGKFTCCLPGKCCGLSGLLTHTLLLLCLDDALSSNFVGFMVLAATERGNQQRWLVLYPHLPVDQPKATTALYLVAGAFSCLPVLL